MQHTISATLMSTDERYAGATGTAPTSGSRRSGARSIELAAPRGGRASCQLVVCSSRHASPARIEPLADAPGEISVRIRRIGCVPLPHYNTGTEAKDAVDYGTLPAMVPDPLFDDTITVISGGERIAYWIRLDVPVDAPRGIHRVRCLLHSQELSDESTGPPHLVDTEPVSFEISVRVHELILGPRRGLEVTHWFYADTILDWYGFDTFDEGYWSMLPAYLEDLYDHGTDVLYTPLFTAPTDGNRRPSQLLDIRSDGDGYRFDFSDVERYLTLGRAAGFERFEFPHLFSQWGAGRVIPLYRGQGSDETPLFPTDTDALAPEYRRFLESLLPQLKRFLEAHGLLDMTRFHISDEPHGAEDRKRYEAARRLIREVAPWMRTMDAVSELSYGSEGLTDLPIPVISAVGAYLERGIRCGTYFCCNPRGRYINRLLDTPLTKIRALGWMLYRNRGLISTFLHWGYNYWYRSQTRELVDPFAVTDGGRWPGWAFGDTFVVYPGGDGPIDSIRWEAFAEGLESYRLLESAGIGPDEQVLAALRGFDDFPLDPGWYARATGEVLSRGGSIGRT